MKFAVAVALFVLGVVCCGGVETVRASMFDTDVLGVTLFPSLSSRHSVAWNPKPQDFIDWMKEGGYEITGREPFQDLRRKVVDRVRKWAESSVAALPEVPNTKDYPYFGFLPTYVGSVLPGGPAISWENACFQTNTASAVQSSASTVTVTLNVNNATSWLCSDLYMLGSTGGISLKNVFSHGTYTVDFNLTGLSDAQMWDINNNGIRVFKFVDNVVQAVLDVISTALLFTSDLTQGVPSWVGALNVDFISKYRGVTMIERPVQVVNISEDNIQSGDFFGIIRLDGLDPTFAWAMGSTTGHTTVALRIDGELYVAESTVNDSYWPTNGIQKTPYQQWFRQAQAAGFQVVHAPLTAEYRAKFNETAAALRFAELEGFNYGYHNMIFGWLDTIKDNYPCIPPDYTQCLDFETLQMIIAATDNLAPSIADLMFLQALNLRLGTSGLRFAEVIRESAAQGIPLEQLPTMPEQDGWIYNTTRYGVPTPGPAMICCVFVCNMWKAGGIFEEIGDELNCAEFADWDVYALTIMDNTSPRPAECVAADPNNQLCQLLGQYTLNLDRYSSKKMYPWMAETCPSLPPLYNRPDNC